jgi:hypothetical protein
MMRMRASWGTSVFLVMPALGAGIHVLLLFDGKKDVDGRDGPGHDGKR